MGFGFQMVLFILMLYEDYPLKWFTMHIGNRDQPLLVPWSKKELHGQSPKQLFIHK